jgi:hypothetical protein
MLVKVGDTWIDPMRVDVIADGEWVEEVATAYTGWSLGWPPPTTSVHRVNANDPCATLWIDGSYVAHGVDGDEAARIINRCREVKAPAATVCCARRARRVGRAPVWEGRP